ncbi:MAG: universal stress protein [Thermoguttaceae bacterium]|jgi:nucleotide-binding universal stress UspA family protein
MDYLSPTATAPYGGHEVAQPGTQAATVLVPLDGTKESLAALPVARLIAELEHAALHLVHISDQTQPARELLSHLQLNAEDVRGVILDQGSGNPADEIVRIASQQKSPYIVMCTHTGQKDPISELGVVATEVVHMAPCPVILVPPDPSRQLTHLRHVLLPHDGTPTTAATAGPALEFVERTDAELIVLHVTAAGSTQPMEPGSMTAPRYVDQAQYEWPSWVHEFLERAHCPQEQTSRLRMALAVGETGEEINRFARDNHIDLIVCGWHGTLNAEHAGAIRSVLHEPPCPLLLLRLGEVK